MKEPEDGWCSPAEAARILGCSRGTFFNWRRKGFVPPPAGYTPYGTARWKRATIHKLLEDGMPAGEDDS